MICTLNAAHTINQDLQLRSLDFGFAQQEAARNVNIRVDFSMQPNSATAGKQAISHYNLGGHQDKLRAPSSEKIRQGTTKSLNAVCFEMTNEMDIVCEDDEAQLSKILMQPRPRLTRQPAIMVN